MSGKKKVNEKEELDNNPIKKTDHEIVVEFIDDFVKSFKNEIDNSLDNEKIKKEQNDYVDSFVLYFKCHNAMCYLTDITKFVSEFTSSCGKFFKGGEKEFYKLLSLEKGKTANPTQENRDFGLCSVLGINENEKVEPTSSEIVIDSSGFDTVEKSTNPKIGMIGVENNLLPYCLHIKNLTDEKLYDVDLFNYNHDKQSKVAYSCTNGVPYEMFLRFLSSLNEAQEEIIRIRFVAVCDYDKFKRKQLQSCVHTIYTEPNGSSLSIPNNVAIYFSAYQQQSDIIDVPLNGENTIKLFNQLQLRFSYLMPEAEVFITIFPSKINK